MSKVKIGVIKEGKVPPDRRVPLTPTHCLQLVKNHPEVELIIQSSDIRSYTDQDYLEKGLTVQEDISDCDILLGVKEVPLDQMLSNKKYFFFSHTYKEQPYNAKLLKTILDKKNQIIDYELLKNKSGNRLIGFGRYAGIVGCYNGFRAWGEKFGVYTLKAAHLCHDRVEMEGELANILLPDNFKLILTGKGRVGQGAIEIISLLNMVEVNSHDFLNKEFEHPVYTHVDTDEYNLRADGKDYERSHFYANPALYESNFARFTSQADMYVACHYWDADAPQIITEEDLARADFKIKVIADISCDIKEPIASTLRPSTIADPFYGYDPVSKKEVAFDHPNAIGIMAVDNLPCELPRDSSIDFGDVLLDKIFPALLGDDSDKIIERASETNLEGELMPDFEYLKDYIRSVT